jgi:zinc transporter, ZIP family
MPLWLTAGLWGFLSGSALILGALIGAFFNLRQSVIATVMAFGSGVLISALSFDLMDEAYKQGGFVSIAVGFLSGAVIYTAASWALGAKGAKHRKRSNGLQVSETDHQGSGSAIALGALLDGIPESIVIGLSLLSGKGVSLVAVIAKSGRSMTYIFTVWTAIALLSGFASLLGYTVFGSFSPEVISATTAVAAGAILSMLIDTMIPEAHSGEHDWAGLVSVAGFLSAFIISKLGA